MGDRCCLTLRTRLEDVDKFDGLADAQEFINEDGVAVLEVEEADYGGIDALTAAAACGAVFYGSHGSGDSYTSGAFASDGKQYFETATDGDNFYVVISPETGKPLKGELQAMRRFVADYRAVVARVDNPQESK